MNQSWSSKEGAMMEWSNKLQSLIESGWWDARTRGVVLSCILQNSETKIWFELSLLFEQSIFGKVSPSRHSCMARLDIGKTNADKIFIIFDVIGKRKGGGGGCVFCFTLTFFSLPPPPPPPLCCARALQTPFN